MTHIMLDLETWGRKPGADIRSIGACVFDPIAPYGGFVGMQCPSCINGVHAPWGCVDCLNTGKDMRGEFYIACNNPIGIWRNGQFEKGIVFNKKPITKYFLTRENETVQWWSEQSPEAQAAFNNPVDLKQALLHFTSWIVNLQPNAPITDADIDIRLWANDPHFDVSILATAFDAVGLPIPWHYRAPRSFRTIVELSGMTREDMRQFDTGTTHNALDDAISQAKIVCEAYKRLGLVP